jgi:KTSC domain-containing protein
MTMHFTDTSRRSTGIARIGYDPARLTLQIGFKDGGTYQYTNVSPRDYLTFANQPSLGKAYNQMFYGKPKLYPSTKLPEP